MEICDGDGVDEERKRGFGIEEEEGSSLSWSTLVEKADLGRDRGQGNRAWGFGGGLAGNADWLILRVSANERLHAPVKVGSTALY